MFLVTYYRPHYCNCLGIQQGGNTSLLLSAAMYLDNRGADENGAVMNLDWKLVMNRGYMLRGTIDDVRGFHSKL